jgi:hypothetical protein
MRSPFYDSLVVVVVETPDSRPLHALFRQADLAPHTIRIESGGRAGNPGADGREARSTPECTDGEDGTDGQEGGRGGDGGQITVIGDADNPWLQDLFELASTGGAAGAGGMGGRGGPPGIRRPGPDGVLCPQPRGGRNGRRGANGLPGVGGPAPKRLDSSLSLMWFGSQSYEDPKTSKVLSAMLNYTLHPRP